MARIRSVSGEAAGKGTKTALYRHFDERGALLYVGVSLSAAARLAQHEAGSSWADRIAHVTVEWFPCRSDAMRAERKAIIDERPAHNVAHNANVRSGLVAPSSGQRPPAIPVFVTQPEAVAAYMSVSLHALQRMIAAGMPRRQIGARRYEYDISAIKAWVLDRTREHDAKKAAAKAAEKARRAAADMEEMRAAVALIGAAVTALEDR